MVDASVPGPSTGAPDATPPKARRREALGTWAGGADCRSWRWPGDVAVGRGGAAGGAVARLQWRAAADLVNLKSLRRMEQAAGGQEGREPRAP
jgi:hypothetical protein